MTNVNPGKWASAEFLSRIRRDVVLGWLRPMAGYFAGRGLALPAGEERIDYEALAKILTAPGPEMPAALLEALCVFRELESESAMDAIRDEAERRGVGLGLGDEATPLDVVVRAWTLDQELVEHLHQRLELKRPRSFKCFSTDTKPLPVFAGPTPEQLSALEERLNGFYEAWKRGKGARVFPSQEGDVWLFLVRHGAPCRREGAMKEDTPTTVFYRPLRHDLLKYHAGRGEMAVNCCADRERRVLLRLFGKCLFGRADYFPGAAQFTLKPLVQQGRACLACADVPGIEWVNLVGVELDVTEDPKHRDIRKGQDIFRLVEREKLAWPEDVANLKRATFAVKFWRVKRPRSLTIVPCNRVIYGREGDSRLLEPWLLRRGFMEGGLGDNEERSMTA